MLFKLSIAVVKLGLRQNNLFKSCTRKLRKKDSVQELLQQVSFLGKNTNPFIYQHNQPLPFHFGSKPNYTILYVLYFGLEY